MLLSEGQMSDFKGAALMLSALPKAKELLADRGYMPTGSAMLWPNAKSPSAFRPNPIGKSRSPMTQPSISSVTGSKTCSDGSKTGAAFIPDMTAAPTPSSLISVSRRVIFRLNQ